MSATEFERQQLVQRLMVLQNQIAYLRMAIATERESCERSINRIVNEMRTIEDELVRLQGIVAASPEEAVQIEDQRRRLMLRYIGRQYALANERVRCNQRLKELQDELNRLFSEFEQVRQRLFMLGGGV